MHMYTCCLSLAWLPSSGWRHIHKMCPCRLNCRHLISWTTLIQPVFLWSSSLTNLLG